MRTFLIFAAAFGVAYAGVGVLSPSEEAEALQLFAKLCSGYGSDGQDIGWTRVYCKRGSGEITENTNHKVNVPGSSGQAQTVFIQPPPARYHHNVEIWSGGNQGGQTKIYVLPQKATHTVTPNVQKTPGTQVKPVVYFLNNGASSTSTGYGPPSKQPSAPSYGSPPPPHKPPQNYGPPAKLPPPSYEVPIEITTGYGR
ncbi:hypothetical protein Ocin01_08947 [Orchesella cincta]|uniref:Uncharacterized protein n=1 Tax=Orchesella cincta TaxID=48709 RepID=A0A1D2MY54_ORCCI|nr:hypothetical protein Ocin01_08947 [Orchesella cincta]